MTIELTREQESLVRDLVKSGRYESAEALVEAAIRALEGRLQTLEAEDRGARTLEWLKTAVWTNLPETERGHAPSKKEQEDLLGF